MKKIFFFAAVSAIALTACNKHESVVANLPEGLNAAPAEISVANATRSTKGYVVASVFEDSPYDALHNSSAFSKCDSCIRTPREMLLSAYYVPQSGEAGNYFVAEKFAKDTTDGLWHHTPKIYWPVAAQKVDFLAISSVLPFEGTAIQWNAENAASEVVLNVGEKYKQDDILYGAVANRQTAGGNSVAMTFNHTQAWIEFQLKTGSAAMDSIITIKSITLKNIYSRGELTIKGGNSPAAVWDFQKESAKDVVMDDTYGCTGDGKFIVHKTSYMDMLIPAQAQTKFVIRYVLAGQPNELEYEYVLNTAQWQAGLRYIYDITFNLYEITVTPTVTAFEDANVSGDGFPSVIE